MHCRNTTFAYHNEFNEYATIERATSEDVFDYLFDIGAEKFLLKNRKKYFLQLFEEYDPGHLKQINEYFDDYPDNNGLEDIIGDKGMQNLNNDD